MAVNNLNTPGVGIQPSLIDAKGDLLVGTADNVVNRLGVTGTTGAVLTADAGETTGLKWAAAGSVGGLVHIETRTVTASSAESFNNVFNSTYQNYRIVGSLVGSAADDLNIRFRVGGTDNSSSVYQRQRLGAFGTNVTATRATNTSSARLSVTSTSGGIFSIDVYNPNLSAITSLFVNFATNLDTNVDIEVSVNTHNSTTVFDGFTLLPATGNITGTIRIYGYQN
jgi:hypothetical protein